MGRPGSRSLRARSWTGFDVLPAAVHHDGRVPARSFFAVSDDARAAIIWSKLEHIREPVAG